MAAGKPAPASLFLCTPPSLMLPAPSSMHSNVPADRCVWCGVSQQRVETRPRRVSTGPASSRRRPTSRRSSSPPSAAVSEVSRARARRGLPAIARDRFAFPLTYAGPPQAGVRSSRRRQNSLAHSQVVVYRVARSAVRRAMISRVGWSSGGGGGSANGPLECGSGGRC